MKSMGLAALMFALIVMSAAFDSPGLHPTSRALLDAQSSTRKAHASIASTASDANSASNEKTADEDDDDGDGELVNTFLVTPRQLPAALNPAVALRYD